LEAQQARVTTLLTARLEVLKQAAALLIEREVLDGEQLREMVVEASR
jgi:ATP-dependent Zn protease